jgi:DNA-binding PucR family transcriptional regulator
MLEITLRMLAAQEVAARQALIEAAAAAFHPHPANRILSPGGFRFALSTIIRNLQDADIYEDPDIWQLIDFMYRDDVHPLIQLRVHKILIDKSLEGRRKMRAIRAVIGPDPVVPMPG